MKRRTIVKFLLIVLIVIFELQFLSHLVQSSAPKDPGKGNVRFYKLGHYLFPTDAESTFKYGFSLLVKSRLDQNQVMTGQSIKYLKHAIAQNMFFYKAHFFLAKAYLHKSTASSQFFSEALLSFKRAIKIRRNNADVGVDALTLLLSLWPHLDEKDKGFCRNLFVQLLPKIKRQQFIPLLEVWGYYVKDFDLITRGLRGAPQFYFDVAKAIPRFDLDLGLRLNLMAKNEIFKLERIKAKMQELKRNKINYQRNMDDVHHFLIRWIKGYFNLVKEANFNERNYFELKGQIEQKRLLLFLDSLAWQNDLVSRQKLLKFLHEILNTVHTRVNLEKLRDILDRKGLFNLNDLPVFYVRQLIDFKLNQMDAVINDTETLKHAISFVKKEHLNTYTKILLILARAYYANRLLSRAMIILQEIRKINPEPPEIYWQIMRIEQILGVDEVEDLQKREKYELLRTKKTIELNSSSWRGVVYLVDTVGFDIIFSDSLKKKMENHHVIQVFIDGLIHKEVLAREIGDSLQIVFSEVERFAKIDVEIKII